MIVPGLRQLHIKATYRLQSNSHCLRQLHIKATTDYKYSHCLRQSHIKVITDYKVIVIV